MFNSKSNLFFSALCAMSVIGLSACLPSNSNHSTATSADPEGSTGWHLQKPIQSSEFMVVSANPYATDIGAKVIRSGGGALDAAVAVQAALTLVEPQSSGIGGGAFILYWDAKEKKLYTLDARETAPQEATPDLFLDDSGHAVPWIEAVVGGRSVGTPSVIKGLEVAHEKFGKLPWASLFQDSIQLAQEGFIVSERLAQLVLEEINPGIGLLEPAKSYFYPNGEPIKAGQLKKNLELATSLKKIADEGSNALMRGELAKKIVAAVRNSEVAPGLLSLKDLESYQPVWREAVCGE